MTDILAIGNVGFSPEILIRHIDSDLTIRWEPTPAHWQPTDHNDAPKVILVDLDHLDLRSSTALIAWLKLAAPSSAIIGYVTAPTPELTIETMKAGATRLEPKITFPQITATLIQHAFDDLDLFKKATQIVDARHQSQLENLMTHSAIQVRTAPLPPELRPTVLILEDEDLLRNLIRTGVSKQNCTPITAGSITEALAKIETTDRIDIALLDVGLPDGQGSDVLEPLLQRHPKSATVMLTAFSDMELIMNCFKLGAIDYLVKPFDTAKFNLVLSRLAHQHRLRQLTQPNLGK